MKRSSMKRFVLLGSLIALVAAGCSSDDTSSAATNVSAATTVAPATTSAPSTGSSTADTAPGVTTATPDTASPDTTGAPADTGGNTDTSVDPSTITKGGTLKLAIDGEAGCYIPSLCTISYGPASVRSAVLENLVRPANNALGYDLVLADSVEPNADFTTFTVKLKSGVKWSDGTPLVAGDIKTLFDTYVLDAKSSIKGNVSSIASTDAPNDSTVVFTLSAAQAPFPALLTLVPIWKPTAGQTVTDLPIGTGPFMFKTWEPNVETTLVRNPNYWGRDSAGNQLPYLDEIDATAITSGDTRVNAVQSGQADLAMSTDPLEIASFNDVATVTSIALNAGGGIFFNTAKAPTDDVRVRQALAYATNKADILEAIGGGEVRDEYFVKASAWYSTEASAATPSFDADKAKSLLDEYINDPARSDGQPVGTPLTINLAHVAGAVTQESIVALAQQQWSDVGVTVNITPEDQATLIGDAISGNYNTTYFGWATPTPYSLLTHNYGPPASTPTNFTHFDSADLQTIIGEMAVAKDQATADDLVQQVDMIFAQQVPVLFLHSTTIGWAAADTVGNLPLNGGDGSISWPTTSMAG